MTARRLTPEEAADVLASATPIPSGRSAARAVRTTFVGEGPDGTPQRVTLADATVVLVLSTTCDACEDLAGLVGRGVVGAAVIGVLRRPAAGLPDEGVDALVRRGGTWLCGDDGFEALDVRAGPYFCLVDAAGTVLVEGVAFGASHVADHVARALAGEPRPDVGRLSPGAR